MAEEAARVATELGCDIPAPNVRKVILCEGPDYFHCEEFTQWMSLKPTRPPPPFVSKERPSELPEATSAMEEESTDTARAEGKLSQSPGDDIPIGPSGLPEGSQY